MKPIILIIGLLVVGCGKKQSTNTNESTPTTNTNKVDGTTEKPFKELTLREKVVGTYENKEDNTSRGVFLDNGVWEVYYGGKKNGEHKWIIVDGELHMYRSAEDEDGLIGVFRINKDGSITIIANIDKDGERKDVPKEFQRTFIKIK